jgi:signal transduction histidine kinase
LTGDRELIAQAAANLLENAQRHTPVGTLIRLTLTAVGNHLCLQVNDNGPGVSKSDRSRIIKRFQRLDRSRNTPGHGLGLNLVDAVAKIHGGRLIFKDNGPGLVAVIELPRVLATA